MDSKTSPFNFNSFIDDGEFCTSTFHNEPAEDSDDDIAIDDNISPSKLCDRLSRCCECREARQTYILSCGHQFCNACQIDSNSGKYFCKRCNESTSSAGLIVNYPGNLRVLGPSNFTEDVVCRLHLLSLDLFCLVCNTILCEKCYDANHKTHGIRFLLLAPDIVAKEITHHETMASIVRARLDVAMRQMNCVTQSKDNLIKDMQDVSCKLFNVREDYVAAIDKRLDALRTETFQFGQKEVEKLDEVENRLKVEASRLRRYKNWFTLAQHYCSPLQRMDLCTGLDQQLHKLFDVKIPELDGSVPTLRFEPPTSVASHVCNAMGVLRTQALNWPDAVSSQCDKKMLSSAYATSSQSVLSHLFGGGGGGGDGGGSSSSTKSDNLAILQARSLWATDPAGRQTQSLCHIPGEVSLTGGATLAAWCNADKSLSLDEVAGISNNGRESDMIENVAPMSSSFMSKKWSNSFLLSNDNSVGVLDNSYLDDIPQPLISQNHALKAILNTPNAATAAFTLAKQQQQQQLILRSSQLPKQKPLSDINNVNSDATLRLQLSRSLGSSSTNMDLIELSCDVVSPRSKMQYHTKFGEFGLGDAQFTEPSGVAVNAHQDIIVADTNNHRIQVFDASGQFRFKFGENGRRNGQFMYPNRVAVNKRTGDIIITERSPTHQVQVYTSFGQFVRKFGNQVLQHPRGVCVDKDGRIIVVECKVMRVVIFDQVGSIVHQFKCTRLQFPNSIAVDDNYRIYISDNRAHCVRVFSYNGSYLGQIGHQGLTNYPIGVAVKSDGTILIADNHNNFNVTMFTPNGHLVQALESKVKHAQCFDVDILADGSIVLASKDYRIYVYKYAANQSEQAIMDD